MAVSVIVNFEATVEQYDQVNQKLDVENNPADGLIIHTGAEQGDGKMRVIDVWESAEAFGKWAEAQLGPAVTEVMGPDAPTVEPEITELHDVLKP